ncbi:MAG: hypothetical protein SP1CHLAM54_03210 [Chlamydiia bacterium]|nr:hypothetical protein [Chlamydiia bacterium]MCH9615237.1 hypothetical protein [Chlamydiia bacterium]MCH9628441.1 hypothetical protein [Chlamydiia bacterium]
MSRIVPLNPAMYTVEQQPLHLQPAFVPPEQQHVPPAPDPVRSTETFMNALQQGNSKFARRLHKYLQSVGTERSGVKRKLLVAAIVVRARQPTILASGKNIGIGILGLSVVILFLALTIISKNQVQKGIYGSLLVATAIGISGIGLKKLIIEKQVLPGLNQIAAVIPQGDQLLDDLRSPMGLIFLQNATAEIIASEENENRGCISRLRRKLHLTPGTALAALLPSILPCP